MSEQIYRTMVEIEQKKKLQWIFKQIAHMVHLVDIRENKMASVNGFILFT